MASLPAIWMPLPAARNGCPLKVGNLRRAVRAGLTVPEPTMWGWADGLEQLSEQVGPPAGMPFPCVVRSASPSEDTERTSNAGRFHSEIVPGRSDWQESLHRVINSLPQHHGRRLGAVFVQAFVAAARAGITAFDGFYFEETSAPGTNRELTAGHDRGRVERGHVQRDDPRCAWLSRLHRLFRYELDIEWAERDDGQRVLLQVRPALFPIRRCETVSLANFKESLGDAPSPWITSVVAAVGNPILELASKADSTVPAPDEPLVVDLADRPWLNFSSLYRLMDHWGLPRTLVSHGIGGAAAGPLDQRFRVARFWRTFAAKIWMTPICFWTDWTMGCRLRDLDTIIAPARTLPELWRASVIEFRMSIRINLILITMATVLAGVRRWLGLGSEARPVTQEMMESYAQLAAEPDPEKRRTGLDGWLRRFGHRGPLETDPAQPRFLELRDTLLADLGHAFERGARVHSPRPRVRLLTQLLCIIETRREWFRDELMRRVQVLRGRVLDAGQKAVESGWLNHRTDVFFLRGEDLDLPGESWRARVTERRAQWDRSRRLVLPTTTDRDTLERLNVGAETVLGDSSRGRFHGIGLGSGRVRGRVVKARDLREVLRRDDLPNPAVLVVTTLEPSWSLVFPRFEAVIAELGGELSHAAILLREAMIPTVINAHGAFLCLRLGFCKPTVSAVKTGKTEAV